ncbi:putative proline rich protein membrane protein [Streptomyces sp. Tu6071]|nr:putative proline rich protein membrane protein [Streptomyces sp. Tu6071]
MRDVAAGDHAHGATPRRPRGARDVKRTRRRPAPYATSRLHHATSPTSRTRDTGATSRPTPGATPRSSPRVVPPGDGRVAPAPYRIRAPVPPRRLSSPAGRIP